MFRLTRRQAAMLLVPSFASARAARKKSVSLQAAIDRELASATPLASAFLGALVVRLADGAVLYKRNQDHLFVPASNAKLFTTALALMRLGPNYRFTTSVIAQGPVDANGNLQGDLVLVGRGDPSLSSRIYPYTTEPSTLDPLQAIEDLADQLITGGVRAVAGDIVGDDTRYPWAPYPSGWAAGDETWDYGAPVSALTINDNWIAVTIQPAEDDGELARISLLPPIEYFNVSNRIVTDAAPKKTIHLERHAGSRELELWGRIGIRETPTVEKVAVPDPALFAAMALRDALTRRGIAVHGDVAARHRPLSEADDSATAAPTGSELARRTSPPLIQLLQVIDKVSQNLHAEILLREVGAVRRNQGTLKAGLLEMDDFLASAGLDSEQHHLRDGSGLSRNALVTPEAIVKLLVFLARSPVREQFLGLLPVGGEDGSLRLRFKGHKEARSVHAKTGTLSDVHALSGYAESQQHGMVAFSFMVNNVSGDSLKVSRFLDNIGLKLLP